MTLEEAINRLQKAGMDTTHIANWTIWTAFKLDTENAYADYSAWETWMNKHMDEPCQRNSPNSGLPKCSETGTNPGDCLPCRMFHKWEEMESDEKALLYGLFWKAFERPEE